MQIKQIVEGHIKELFGKEEELFKTRRAICIECPLYKVGSFGPVCNSELYLNPTTGVVKQTGGEGFFRGCACRLDAKSRIPDAHCPAGKW